MPVAPLQEARPQLAALAESLRELQSALRNVGANCVQFERRAAAAAEAIEKGKRPREVDTISVLALIDQFIEVAERNRARLIEAQRVVDMNVTDVRSASGEDV